MIAVVVAQRDDLSGPERRQHRQVLARGEVRSEAVFSDELHDLAEILEGEDVVIDKLLDIAVEFAVMIVMRGLVERDRPRKVEKFAAVLETEEIIAVP